MRALAAALVTVAALVLAIVGDVTSAGAWLLGFVVVIGLLILADS